MRKFGFFCPAERRLRGNLAAACSYLKGSSKGDRVYLFLVVADGKRRIKR